MDNAKIKQNIYKKRIEKGYSQSHVASLLNISQTSYQKIEKGVTALISNRLPLLATIFELSEAELVLGYIPDERINSKSLEEFKQEALLNESSIKENFNIILSEKAKRIKELEEVIRDKNEIINFYREKLKEPPK